MRLKLRIERKEPAPRFQHWSWKFATYPMAYRLHLGPIDIVWWRVEP